MASQLTPPRLDDRSWEDLRTELVRRIPAHTPEWTDHNASDPGVAVLEVFAWLAQNLLFRMNQVPDNSTRKFLDLLGYGLRSARPAQAMVELALKGTGLDPIVVPSTDLAERVRLSAGDQPFEALGRVAVLPVEGLVVVRDPAPVDLPEDTLEAMNDLVGYDGEGSDAPAPLAYRTRPLPLPENGLLPEATQLGLAVDRSVWIALLVPERLARSTTREQVAASIAGYTLNIGVRVDDRLPDSSFVEACPEPGSSPRNPAVSWQIATHEFLGGDAERRWEHARYDRATIESDGTCGLSCSGVVRLRLPEDPSSFLSWTAEHLDDPDFEGLGTLPPRLDDPKLAARVITWIRAFRPESPDPSVRWVGVNAVEVEQSVRAPSELLGYGTGRPSQQLRLVHSPVLPRDLLVEVGAPGATAPWVRVPDFGASAPDDPHYLLEDATGVVTFGDGIHGRMPQPGEIVRAGSYRYGGGAAGNVGAGTIRKVLVPASGLTATNVLPATGGQDAETLEEARVRLPATLRHQDRAVAAQDFVDVAMQTPGVQVGRVHVLPRHKPEASLLDDDGDSHGMVLISEVAGVVTLVILPAYDPEHPDEPMPDRDMLRRVCEHLEPRRLVTTELYLIPPTWVGVWVSAAFEVEEGFEYATVRRWVELAIRQYLAPLAPYGPTAEGWPFGRAVRINDIAAAILRVQGVRLLFEVKLDGEDLPLFNDDGEIDGTERLGRDAAGEINHIAMQRWELPAVRGVQLTDAEQAEDIVRVGAEGPGGQVVFVPVEEDAC